MIRYTRIILMFFLGFANGLVLRDFLTGAVFWAGCAILSIIELACLYVIFPDKKD